MNYARLYKQIIDNRLNTPYGGYTEKHHIIPVCLGGTNSKDNLVRLTAREHFICHWILVKMHKSDKYAYHKLIRAFNMMCNSTSKLQERHKVHSRVFSFYREDLSKAMKLQTGERNSQIGTMWICNIDTRENRKVLVGSIHPAGWVAGRNKWKIFTPRKKLIKEEVSKKYLHGYTASVNGVIYNSISQAADFLGIGHETARMRFKSNSFPEYMILSRSIG